MRLQRFVLVAVAAVAAIGLGGCPNQHTIEGTSSRTLNVAGKQMKVNLSPTDVPNQYDLLVVRDAIVINPDPEAERARGQVAATRVMREVCNVRKLSAQVIEERLVEQLNYYVRFRCT